jgi:hypothetical protein
MNWMLAFFSILARATAAFPITICVGQAAEIEGSPAITAAQIEADWLRQDAVRGRGAAAESANGVMPEMDAAGGCDGVKTGKWGFHTAEETDPWWQVDLGKAAALDCAVMYNRCDETAARTNRIKVQLSSDGRTFQQAYQHNGTTFGGKSDNNPLSVSLQGRTARYVRLQLPGHVYFHLDEVEVYGTGGKGNLALHRPATQSSVSQWSVAHGKPNAVPSIAKWSITEHPIGPILDRGFRLAEDLRKLGAPIDGEEKTLREVASHVPAADASPVAQAKAYFEARWAVRRLALRNPLLDFDSIAFVKHAPGRFPHMSDQFYGWWSRPGGGVFVLDGLKTDRPKVRCLTTGLAEGSFIRPDLSYDGKRVLFAYARYHAEVADLSDKANKANLPEDAFFHVFEANLDGSGIRQVTHGRYDDFDARYLPSGDIVYLSTRKGVFLQCTKANTLKTIDADLPDSYVRCGGDNYRPVPVFTLHRMNAAGGDMRPLSAFENFEWTPSIASDGRILYTRWDYIDRFNGHFFSLWSTNPDGTNPQLVYGNYTTRPQVKFEARSIPGSHRLICTAGAHHSNVGGSLILLDRNRGTEDSDPVVRLTPEVPFPETEAFTDSYFANPCPLSERHYLVAWSDRRLPPHCRVDDTNQNPINATGLYLLDVFGDLNLIYRDPEISSECPLPVCPRPMPPIHSDTVAWDGPQEGCFLLQDVYVGLAGVPRGAIKHLRLVAVPPKVQPQMNSPSLGVSAEDPGKFVLGTVPVEKDGSAAFRAPSGIPIFFQALDEQGLAVQTMRSLTYVQPGQTLSCVGCHESREASPPLRPAPLAFARAPSKITLGPLGSWPLRYDELVQPVLDRSCTSCHRPDSGNTGGDQFDLTANTSYGNLLGFAGGNLKNLAFERDRSAPNHGVARQSKLWSILTGPKPHEGVSLDPESLRRLATWMDIYAQRTGHFSGKQEEELRQLRTRLASLLCSP